MHDSVRNQLSSGDTIVALATPPGEASLAVVRLSGPQSVAIARAIFQSREFQQECRSHQAYYGLAMWPLEAEARGGTSRDRLGPSPGEPLDEVVVLPMLEPRSYTGEDVVEFFCHGGQVPARRVVQACLAAGARPAGPGEYTRRAFLNGKLSLDQAEAVADLISAEDELAASAALQQLRGGFDRQLHDVEMPLRRLLTELEGSLEFAEEEEVDVSGARIAAVIDKSTRKLERLISLAAAGRHLRQGIQVVIAGPANVGKSSLLNAMVGKDRALVDHEPGTTRDIVSERVHRGGCLFVLHDTAGLRQEAGRVESMGIGRTRQALAEADIVLELREAAHPTGLPGQAEQTDTGGQLQAGIDTRDGCVILSVLTKADLATGAPGQAERTDSEAIRTSAVSKEGLDLLWEKLADAVDADRMREAATLGVLLNDRHQHRLMKCLDSLRLLARDIVDQGPGDEVVASILASIMAELGEISGRVFSESLLEDIFSRFCVGK